MRRKGAGSEDEWYVDYVGGPNILPTKVGPAEPDVRSAVANHMIELICTRNTSYLKAVLDLAKNARGR